MELLKWLKPVDAKLKMKRLGPHQDGGYVMPEKVLTDCAALFTYGIAGEIRYEADFHFQYNKPVYAYDHTVDFQFPYFIQHKKEGLGFEKDMSCFVNHYLHTNVQGPAYVKIDIEGGEYPYFLNADIDLIADFTIGLSVEVHWLDKEDTREQFIEMMKRLSKRFTLVHTHANTWGDFFNYEGIDILNVYELSFINTDYISDSVTPITIDYPIVGLDYSNNPDKEDFKFDFFKMV